MPLMDDFESPLGSGVRAARKPTSSSHRDWVQQLQAIAQNGLHYAENDFDRERYRQVAAIAGAMAQVGEPWPADLFLARQLLERGHATPKVDVRGVVFHEERILLVRERDDGRWSLPGGWADIGDAPSTAVEREIREESGWETRATRVLAVCDRNQHGYPPYPFHVYKLFLECRLTGGSAVTSAETSQVDFFSESALPPLSLTRVLPGQIARFFQQHRDPGLPVDFD